MTLPLAPLSPVAATPSAEPPTAEPMVRDAFQSMLSNAGSELSMNPQAIGQTLLSDIDGFSAHEADFSAAVKEATEGDAAAQGGAAGSAAGAATGGRRGLTAAAAISEGEALQNRTLGVMMQTYSFALEATVVTNAATTFTSSVNTLIKTQ